MTLKGHVRQLVCGKPLRVHGIVTGPDLSALVFDGIGEHENVSEYEVCMCFDGEKLARPARDAGLFVHFTVKGLLNGFTTFHESRGQRPESGAGFNTSSD